jgi:hypothetical protein
LTAYVFKLLECLLGKPRWVRSEAKRWGPLSGIALVTNDLKDEWRKVRKLVDSRLWLENDLQRFHGGDGELEGGGGASSVVQVELKLRIYGLKRTKFLNTFVISLKARH